jgi:hypothetical protein
MAAAGEAMAAVEEVMAEGAFTEVAAVSISVAAASMAGAFTLAAAGCTSEACISVAAASMSEARVSVAPVPLIFVVVERGLAEPVRNISPPGQNACAAAKPLVVNAQVNVSVNERRGPQRPLVAPGVSAV